MICLVQSSAGILFPQGSLLSQKRPISRHLRAKGLTIGMFQAAPQRWVWGWGKSKGQKDIQDVGNGCDQNPEKQAYLGKPGQQGNMGTQSKETPF